MSKLYTPMEGYTSARTITIVGRDREFTLIKMVMCTLDLGGMIAFMGRVCIFLPVGKSMMDCFQ